MNKIHPWVVLKRIFDELWLQQEVIAQIINKPKSKVNLLFNWKIKLTPEWGFLIKPLLDSLNYKKISIIDLLKMQAEFDLEALKSTEWENENLDEKVFVYKEYPVKQLIKRNYIHWKNIISEMKELLWITDIKNTNDIFQLSSLHRESMYWIKNTNNIKVWLKIAHNLSKKQPSLWRFNLLELKELLNNVSWFTRKDDWINSFLQKLKEVWVSIVFLKHFEKTRMDWATFWDNEIERPVVVMSMRYSRLDYFRFTLLHELSHIILHLNYIKNNKSNTIDWFKISSEEYSQREKEANDLASELLLNCKKRDEYKNYLIDRNSIILFSEKFNTHPSLVVWRLKFENIIQWNEMTRITNTKVPSWACEWFIWN